MILLISIIREGEATRYLRSFGERLTVSFPRHEKKERKNFTRKDDW